MQLHCNFNQYSKQLGIYYFTEKAFLSKNNEENFKNVIKECYLVIDEYDWIFFDGSIEKMLERKLIAKEAYRVIGFTGSELTETEV